MVPDMHPDDLLALAFHIHRGVNQSVENFTTADKRSFIRMWEPEPERQEGSNKTKLSTSALLAYLKQSVRR